MCNASVALCSLAHATIASGVHRSQKLQLDAECSARDSKQHLLAKERELAEVRAQAAQQLEALSAEVRRAKTHAEHGGEEAKQLRASLGSKTQECESLQLQLTSTRNEVAALTEALGSAQGTLLQVQQQRKAAHRAQLRAEAQLLSLKQRGMEEESSRETKPPASALDVLPGIPQPLLLTHESREEVPSLTASTRRTVAESSVLSPTPSCTEAAAVLCTSSCEASGSSDEEAGGPCTAGSGLAAVRSSRRPASASLLGPNGDTSRGGFSKYGRKARTRSAHPRLRRATSCTTGSASDAVEPRVTLGAQGLYGDGE